MGFRVGFEYACEAVVGGDCGIIDIVVSRKRWVLYWLLQSTDPKPVSPVIAEDQVEEPEVIVVTLPVKDTIALSPLLVRGHLTTGDTMLDLKLEQADGVLVESEVEVAVNNDTFQAQLELREYTSGPALLTLRSQKDPSVQTVVPIRLSAQ